MILLTGASGVIGSELVSYFSPDELLLASYRAKPCEKYRHIKIDIQKPKLGLSDQEYTDILSLTKAVIHCAAITDTNADHQTLQQTNIVGTKNIINFSRDAGATLHFISTAFCSRQYGRNIENSPYLSSKREAEQLVVRSGVRSTIIRPSIVIGHSLSGRAQNFQGFHLFLASIVQGRLPFIPLDAKSVCDFLPVDFIAHAIEKIVRTPQFSKPYWLTAGVEALTIREMLRYAKPFADRAGVDLDALKMIEVDLLNDENLSVTKLPKFLRDRANTLIALGEMVTIKERFPSDMAVLTDQKGSPVTHDHLVQGFKNNIRYWGLANGLPFQGPFDST